MHINQAASGHRSLCSFSVRRFRRQVYIGLALLVSFVLANVLTPPPSARASFSPPISSFLGSCPQEISVGEFNDDKKTDLAVGNICSDDVRILLGKGDGSFGAPSQYDHGLAISTAVQDLNADGHQDVIVGGIGPGISVLLGKGDGTFSGPTEYWTAGTGWAISAADLDGDNDKDIVVAHGDESKLSVLLNTGAGAFPKPDASVIQLNVDDSAESVKIGDLNQDSIPDLAIVNRATDEILVFRGVGTGTFFPPEHIGVGESPTDLEIADFNGDDDPDLLNTNWLSESVSVVLGVQGDAWSTESQFSTDLYASRVTVNDFNGDGDADALVTNQTFSNSIALLTGNGDGTFGKPLINKINEDLYFPVSADFNGDQKPDLVTDHINSVRVRLNRLSTPEVLPAAHQFGDQLISKESDSKQVVLTNKTTGGDPISVEKVSLAGPNPDSFAVKDTCEGKVLFSPKNPCVMGIAFKPAAVGLQTASLVIQHDGFGPPLSVQLAGAGVAPDCQTDPDLVVCPKPPTCQTDPFLCPTPPTCETDPGLCPDPATCETEPALCPAPPKKPLPGVTKPTNPISVLDGNKLHIRLKCPARFKPKCISSAVPVTRKGTKFVKRGGKKVRVPKGKPMAAPMKLKTLSNKWIRVTFLIKPSYLEKVKSMTFVDKKLLVTRQQIRSKKIGRTPDTARTNRTTSTVFHTYKVRVKG